MTQIQEWTKYLIMPYIINERLETHKHAYEFNDSVLYIKEPV